MAQTNQERIGKALDLLNKGLKPFVEQEMKAAYGAHWLDQARTALSASQIAPKEKGDGLHFDSQMLLALMVKEWNSVFKNPLGPAERSLVGELQTIRNNWAHQETFNTDDVYRAMDTMYRLLKAVSSPEAVEIDRQRQELLRIRYEEQTRREHKKAAIIGTQGEPLSGLKPWREVITPHPDVASGRYLQAEFAADLDQVHRGEGSDEYRNPVEFYRRTFITDGLKRLLVCALRRLAGNTHETDEPVIELQTNFGGGKTHSMLALFHLFSGVSAAELPGIEEVLKEAGISKTVKCSAAVLVGTALSPGQPHQIKNGPSIHTLWGDLAWQLLKKEGYQMVAESDQKGVSPGKIILEELLRKTAPCLILVDELVAYIRQTYRKEDLSGGSFEANLSFIQSLTEAVKAVPRVLLVASVPSSTIEIGGDAGQLALERLKNLLHRVESSWRPATAEEGFEIVRRRLFQPITEPRHFTERDAVIKAFTNLYTGEHSREFPSECREGAYSKRMTAAYPIHPELFERLSNEWGSLDKFQRTRGVLRLMAKVIHLLWERQDPGLFIMPGMVPLDESSIQSELTGYLEDPWMSVMESDIDGTNSLPLQLDRENPNLGRYSACRRVARTIYLGSAPTFRTPNRGIDDKRIKLGCTQAGESPNIFGDALRRLTDQATHLYMDNQRYWYSTQQTITKTAKERADLLEQHEVFRQIEKNLKNEQQTKGDFARIHVCPENPESVSDAASAGLVILSPGESHTGKQADSPARLAAEKILNSKGAGPRNCKNMLVFLPPDKLKLGDLEQSVRQYLAWDSILRDKETLNLDAFQNNQAEKKRGDAEEEIKRRIPETYQWLLVPVQKEPNGAIEWDEYKLPDQGALAVKASKKLTNSGTLIAKLAGTILKMEIDRIPLWRGDHVSVRELIENFAKYLYLQKIKNDAVILDAIVNGLSLMTWEKESFAYADKWDEQKKRYIGLRAGREALKVIPTEQGLLVKSEAALKQFEKEKLEETPLAPTEGSGNKNFLTAAVSSSSPTIPEKEKNHKSRRFHGSTTLDPARVGRDAGKVAEEVVQHLTGLLGSEVEVTLEIHANIQDGAPDSVVRTVSENCRTLKFDSFGFEEE